MKKSIVLFSGGIDSTTALYWALNRYEKVCALTFDYGQRHKVEISIAQKLVKKLSIPHKIMHVDLKQIGGSSLLDINLPLPEYKRVEQIEEGVPSTYVPFRNGIFLSLAAALAEAEGTKEIVCGFNTLDSPNYPDTRSQFVKAMEDAINKGTKAAVSKRKTKILAPFVNMKKSEIIKKGLSLGVDYSYTISCYFGEEIPCQKCSSCLLRQKAWEEVDSKDPLIFRLEKEGKL
ncbi:MAG: 7-cyano-7-deazaguanine synthase QueC [Candidatus Aminicenantes bacterium]|nr:MAG: 7-cyano-7-deazaguanine synthase QueC [Candidatus Aminicenantes bacterium]